TIRLSLRPVIIMKSSAHHVQRRGRPRNPRLDTAILEAAEKQLRERGFGGMTLQSVAAAAETTVPSLRRRYRDKITLAAAVIGSFYSRYVSHGTIPANWSRRVLAQLWRQS